ncbi:MAG: AAA family ATPase [Candidatus Kariarchaeaceae archaeon]
MTVSKIIDLVEDIKDKYNIVGREDELKLCLAAKLAKKHLLLEGDVGTGKTFLAHSISNYHSQALERVDGDERYTASNLIGHFDPPSVINQGYCWDSFMLGPLTKAMKNGSILFLNEINRLNEGTQNVLLAAMDEGLVKIPKLGDVLAKEGFYIIASMNPAEYVATSPLSEALRDRFAWLKLTYQTEEEERDIVKVRTGVDDDEVLSIAVRMMRETRNWIDLRRGSSIRGAIDLASIIQYLDPTDARSWADAAIMSLVTKVELEDGVEQTIEGVISTIVQKVLTEMDFH